jgi:amidase
LESFMFETAAFFARQIRDKEFSSEELVTDHLERIDQINPKINAVVAFADYAVDQAKKADQAHADRNLAGPLHGVPMTIKDCFDTAGVVSTWGTLGRKDFIPDEDATIIKRLKAAGAILIGKTNTPEFTLNFETHNDLFGFTHNPYKLTHSPGGSSGGAAALLAAGGIPFDIGTDFGGSVRVPSHCCGTVGIKPTSGSVPRTGLCLPPGMFGDDLSHIGPMARRVEDLALLLPILWGPDRVDSRIASVPLRDWEAVDVGNLRCAVMVDNGVVSPDGETAAVVNNAATLLLDAGVKVTEDRIPTSAKARRVEGTLFEYGIIAAALRQLEHAGTDLEQCSLRWLREAADRIPDAVSTDDMAKLLADFEQVRSRSLQFMENYDVLISPVNARPAQPHPEPGGQPFPNEYGTYTSLHNITGFPAGVVRGGTTADGLPIGVQIVAKPWREDIVLAVMSYIENALGPFPRPEGLA